MKEGNMQSTDIMIKTLESRMDDIEGKVDSTLDVLSKMNEKLKKLDHIELGLFGDMQIGHLGVIKKQVFLEDKILDLQKKIEALEKISEVKIIEGKTQRNLKGYWFGIAKQVIQTLINVLMFYLLYRGILSPDAFIKF